MKAPVEIAGRKEVAEAVVVAALVALAQQLVTWGMERVKAAANKRAESRKDAEG
jgi:hypothetical protein